MPLGAPPLRQSSPALRKCAGKPCLRAQSRARCRNQPLPLERPLEGTAPPALRRPPPASRQTPPAFCDGPARLVLDQNVSNPASFLDNGFAELNDAMPENSQNMRDTFVNLVSIHDLATGHALHLGGPRFRDCGRSLEFLFHNLLLQRYSTVS